MSLEPGGNKSYGWNYTKPDKDGYTKTLTGTVVAIQEVQKRSFNQNGQVGAPEFWPEGNPKMNQRIALATPTGELVSFTYQPASKKQFEEGSGVHMQLYALTGNTKMSNLVGKTIQIQTKDPDEDWQGNKLQGMPTQYGSGFPRPFVVQEIQGVTYQLAEPLPHEFTVAELLCDDGASGGQAVPPQNIQTPQQVQPSANSAVPTAQVAQVAPVVQSQPMVQQQAVQAQPVVAQPVAEPVVQPETMVQQQGIQPMQPQIPAGMDPQVAAAMQAVGATNVQPTTDASNYVSEDEIPF